MARLSDAVTLSSSVGLVRPRAPTQRLLHIVVVMLRMPLPAGKIEVATESRFSSLSICKKGDIVIIACSDGFRAAELLANIAVCSVPLSIVSMWETITVNREVGIADFRVRHDAELIETEDILGTVIASVRSDGVGRIILPCHLR